MQTNDLFAPTFTPSKGEVVPLRAAHEVALRLAETVGDRGHKEALETSIRPAEPSFDSKLGRQVARLPLFRTPENGATGDLEFGKTLGNGGMGVVRTATQSSLAREVAAKSIRSDKLDEESARQLLQEAWVMGSLEHPNIVPVYGLGRTAEGGPVMIMKRIEGTRWTAMMHNPAARPNGVSDSLGWNLGILMQVCNAIEFAHSRGIVHRDLKPDNIMIGRFGEVYVVDWGLAVSIDGSHDGRFPLASDIASLAGTPGYMAPEMVAENGDRIGPATDVYLLGAILHRIITGSVRHSGSSLAERLHSSLTTAPHAYDANVPTELADIANRATAPEPGERFGSASELQSALRDFLEHRGSVELAREAQKSLDEILSGDHSSGQATETRLDECVFAFQQALRAWTDNSAARVGLQAALELAADAAMDKNQLWVTRGLLDRMPRRNQAQEERLLGLMTKRRDGEADLTRLRTMEREQDAITGSGVAHRSILILVTSIALALGPLFSSFAVARWGLEPRGKSLLIDPLLAWAVIVPLAIALRLPRFGLELPKGVSRHIVAVVLVALMGVTMSRFGGAVIGLSLQDAKHLDAIPVAIAAGLITYFDSRVLAPCVLLVVVLLGSFFLGGTDAAVGFGAGIILSSCWAGIIWSRPAPQAA